MAFPSTTPMRGCRSAGGRRRPFAAKCVIAACVRRPLAFYSLAMPTISPQQLRGQLREMVDLLAAPVDVQIRWLVTQRCPVDELMLQFDDAVPAWFGRCASYGARVGGHARGREQRSDAY